MDLIEELKSGTSLLSRAPVLRAAPNALVLDLSTGARLGEDRALVSELDRTGLFAKPGTTIHAPLDSEVVLVANNAAELDYGPLVILEHRSSGQRFFTFYGHLGVEVLSTLGPVEVLKAGQPSGAGPRSARGWSLELTVEEDLDADGSRDTTLVLLEDEPEFDRERALVVLLRRGEGYVLGGSNVGLLPCWGCSGVKGGDSTVPGPRRAAIS